MSRKKARRHLALTPAGVGWLIVCVAAFVLATNYNNNIIFMFACLLFGVWLLASLLTYRNMSGVNSAPWQVTPCFAGGVAHYQVSLTSDDQREHFEIGCGQHSVDLINGVEHQWLHVEVPVSARGWFVPNQKMLFSTWPFGLWKVSKVTEDMPACLVYPEPCGSQPLPVVNQLSNDPQDMDELSGVRAYQSGDNLRRVDWKAMARTEQLTVKEFGGDESEKILWLSDNSVVKHVDKGDHQESDLKQLTRWVIDCHNAGVQYGLRIGNETLTPGLGVGHYNNSLQMLALVSRG